MEPLTILHLTDLHFGCDATELDLAKRRLCLNSLVNAVAHLESSWRPKVLCITGDIGWHGAKTDYNEAKSWLEHLLNKLKLGFQDTFVCAGNHDIIRAVANTIARPVNAAEADRIFSDSLGTQYQDAFSNFTNFCKDTGVHPYTFMGNESYLMGECSFHGVRFLGLNSAWFCKGDDDKNKLWVGQPHLQLLESAEQLCPVRQDDGPPTVALIHHPPDWWHAEETNAYGNRPSTRDYLAHRAHLILTGHTHGEVRDADRIATKALHMTGGAAYAGAGYFNAIRLIRVKSDGVEYRSFEFDPKSSEHAWFDRRGVKAVKFFGDGPRERTQVTFHERLGNHSADPQVGSSQDPQGRARVPGSAPSGYRLSVLKTILMTLMALVLVGLVTAAAIKYYKAVKQRKIEEIIRELDRLIRETVKITSPRGLIEKLEEPLDQIEQTIDSSIYDPEIEFRLVWLNLLLEEGYASGAMFAKASETNDREYGHLKRIYDQDPLWHLTQPESVLLVRPKRVVPVAFTLAYNRIKWAFFTHARHYGRIDAGTQQLVEQSLLEADKALRLAKMKNMEGGKAWLMSSLAYWANGNIDLAEPALKEAFQSVPDPRPAVSETRDRQMYFGYSYMVRASLQAERKSRKEAIASIERVKDYLKNYRDLNGILGYMHLLVARASTLPAEQEKSLDTASDHLGHSDNCELCRYTLACVLAKKSEFVEGADRVQLVRQATDHLLFVLDQLKTYPVEPEIRAICSDPFLKNVVNQQQVKNKIASFQWDPKEPVEVPPLWELWLLRIPVKSIRFTRLNGDNRGF